MTYKNDNRVPWFLDQTYIDGNYSKFARFVFLGAGEGLLDHVLFLSFDAIAHIYDNTHQGGGFYEKKTRSQFCRL